MACGRTDREGAVRVHGDFLQVQHFLVNGVDQTLTSEEGPGKVWAHARWVAGPSPSKLDPSGAAPFFSLSHSSRRLNNFNSLVE